MHVEVPSQASPSGRFLLFILFVSWRDERFRFGHYFNKLAGFVFGFVLVLGFRFRFRFLVQVWV